MGKEFTPRSTSTASLRRCYAWLTDKIPESLVASLSARSEINFLAGDLSVNQLLRSTRNSKLPFLYRKHNEYHFFIE
jgi:hypothetical protein